MRSIRDVSEADIVRAYARAGAYTRRAARSLADLELPAVPIAALVKRLRRRGLLRAAGRGRFFLDLTDYLARRQRRRARGVLLAGVALAVGGVVAYRIAQQLRSAAATPDDADD